MIPLAVAKQAGEELSRRLVSNVKIIELIPVGSVRRKAASIKDLDFLVVVKTIPKQITLELSKKRIGIIEDMYNQTPKSLAVRHVTSVLRLKMGTSIKSVKGDFFVCTPKEKPFMLFHYTGSRAYNIRTRANAKRKKWKLNQYGLYHISNDSTHQKHVRNSSRIKTEKDLAKFLGVSYRLPENRIK